MALIQKNKPEWQRGKLNGIGGKVERGEQAEDAMVREFKEETEMTTFTKEWSYFLRLSDPEEFAVYFFATRGDVDELRSTTDEQVLIIEVDSVRPGRTDMLDNLPWVIGLALDHLQDGRPEWVDAEYPYLMANRVEKAA